MKKILALIFALSTAVLLNACICGHQHHRGGGPGPAGQTQHRCGCPKCCSQRTSAPADKPCEKPCEPASRP